MENAPAISLNGFSLYPGVEPELWDRFQKWGNEVYAPLMMKNTARTGSDTYQIVRLTPLYPMRLRIHHYINSISQQTASKSPDQVAIQKDSHSWRVRNVMDVIWSAIYQLEKSFGNEKSIPVDKQDIQSQNASIVHLEAYRLSPEEQANYDKWFADYGMNIFIPLYLKQSGVKKYDFYKFKGIVESSHARDLEYPAYLSLLYFDNMENFAKYENSPELATFQRTLRSVLPLGLNYKWYVQYELKLSLRK